MGLYYVIVCEDLRERIELCCVGDATLPGGWGDKERSLVMGPAARVALHRAIHGAWRGKALRVVDDGGGDPLDDASDDYRDVTEQAIADFNSYWPRNEAEQLRFAPARDSVPPAPEGR